MVFDNLKAGKMFCERTRIALANWWDDSDPTNLNSYKTQGLATKWFSSDDLNIIAGIFDIHAAVYSDAAHWRLVLEVPRPDSMVVYDPLYAKNGNQVYTYDGLRQGNEGQILLLAPLAKHYGIDLFGTDSCTSEGRMAIVRTLRDKNYKLELPTNFNTLKLQEDSHNCGPLVLYAALVAGKYTPQFAAHTNFEKLENLCDIKLL